MDKEHVKGRDHRLVIVKNWKRIFNKVASRNKWKHYARGNEIAAANAIPSEGFYFNAVAFEVSEDEFSELKDREKDYHVETVETWDFESGKTFRQCFIFVSNKEKIRDDIKPIKEYYKACRDAAYSWGEGFGKMFDSTTD